MLLQQDNWFKGYSQILSDCRPCHETHGSGGSVLILCNPDADALCAARILSYAFRADKVPYQLRPCGGFSRLLGILSKLNLSQSQYEEDHDALESDNDDYDDEEEGIRQSMNLGNNNSAIRAIILLNLGATKNLNDALYSPTAIADENGEDTGDVTPPLLSNHIKTFVLDSHRPYHLANVHAGKNIVLWNDYDHWHKDEGGIPSDGDDLSGESGSDDDETDEEEGDTDEEGDETGESDNGEAEFDDSDVHGVQVAEQDEVGNDDRKRSSSSLPETTPVTQKRRRQQDPDTPDTEVMTDEDQQESLSLDGDADDEVDENEGQLQDSDDDDEQNNQSDTENNSVNTQMSGSNMQILSIREQRENRRNKIKSYYSSGSFHSSPVAFMTYTLLSTQLRHDSVGDLLWLACIGVTYAYIHNRLDIKGYITLSMMLQNHVNRVYPDYRREFIMDEDTSFDPSMTNSNFYAEDLYNDDDDDENNDQQQRNRPMTKVGFSENGRIFTQKDEFRFFLLRHVSLWESMVLSSEVNTKMELWKNRGIKKLQEMLAKMGLPLAQCQQPYAFMKPTLKRRLRAMIMEHADDYGLDNLSYTGFIRVSGYKSLLSASDMSLAVTALLECETKSTHDKLTTEDDHGQSPFNEEEEEEQSLIASFNTAYDALNSNGSSSVSMSGGGGGDLSSLVNGGDGSGRTNGVGAGIQLAVSLQSAIISSAMSLVERKAIVRLTHFRYAYLHATSQGVNGGRNFNTDKAASGAMNKKQQHTHHIFAKPLALTKLAHFLMDMHRSNNKWTGTKARPLILLSEKPSTQTYLVVGYEFPENRGSVKRNKFGRKFKLATEMMDGKAKFDSFESNVVEVKASEVQKFIEHLHYMIDSI